MMYFYMYLQSVVPESCLSGTVVKYIICLFYLSDCFQTKACCQTYILFCEFSCISHANNSFCNIRFYPLLHSLLYSLLPSFSYQFFRFQFQNFSTHSFLQSFLCFLRSSKNNPLLSRKVFIEFITNALPLLFSVPVPEMSVYHLQFPLKIGPLFSTNELPCPFEPLP